MSAGRRIARKCNCNPIPQNRSFFGFGELVFLLDRGRRRTKSFLLDTFHVILQTEMQKVIFTLAIDGVLCFMDTVIDTQEWEKLTYKEKNHQLFLREKALLDGFLEHGAISQAQHDKSLHDLIEKMGEQE